MPQFSPFESLSIAEIIVIAGVSVLSILIGALFNQKMTRSRWQQLTQRNELQHQAITDQLQQKCDELTEQLATAQQRLQEYSQALGKTQAQAEQLTQVEKKLQEAQHKQMEAQLSLSKSNAMQKTLQAKHEAESQALQDKVVMLESAEARLKTEFENLANRIFEERTEKFSQQNDSRISHLLNPFKQQLEGFRQQIKESYTHEQNERSALKHQLEHLQTLNLKMSQDAINLTNALKGDNKQQGNWGEVILDRVLQESGLREGHEYQTQSDLKNDDGKRFKPDVIVHLPENKDVVIDSKMSLVAYERFFNSEDDVEKIQATKDHISSLRAHIKGLSQKNYQQLHGIKSLDYVLMFIPIEPAFLLALEHDGDLVNYALENNVMLVSPTNLLVALRTINNIWRYEYQNQHAQRIAQHAGKIYDKLCGYLADMQKLGRALETADASFNTAMKKLSTGKGNLIRQAHQMQQLGVETSKKIDNAFLDDALNENLDAEQENK
ncbi:MAG: DNA recombination protein RmuC [Parashewanella sp.]